MNAPCLYTKANNKQWLLSTVDESSRTRVRSDCPGGIRCRLPGGKRHNTNSHLDPPISERKTCWHTRVHNNIMLFYLGKQGSEDESKSHGEGRWDVAHIITLHERQGSTHIANQTTKRKTSNIHQQIKQPTCAQKSRSGA